MSERICNKIRVLWLGYVRMDIKSSFWVTFITYIEYEYMLPNSFPQLGRKQEIVGTEWQVRGGGGDWGSYTPWYTRNVECKPYTNWVYIWYTCSITPAGAEGWMLDTFWFNADISHLWPLMPPGIYQHMMLCSWPCVWLYFLCFMFIIKWNPLTE